MRTYAGARRSDTFAPHASVCDGYAIAIEDRELHCTMRRTCDPELIGNGGRADVQFRFLRVVIRLTCFEQILTVVIKDSKRN